MEVLIKISQADQQDSDKLDCLSLIRLSSTTHHLSFGRVICPPFPPPPAQSPPHILISAFPRLLAPQPPSKAIYP